MKQDLTEHIIKVRDAIRRRNEKCCLKKGSEIHLVIFKMIVGLFTIIAIGIIILLFVFSDMGELLYDVGLEAGTIVIVMAAGVILLVGGRAYQLHKQKEEHGDYVDFDNEVEEYEEWTLLGRRRYTAIPVLDFLAHNLLVFICPPKIESKPPIKLNDTQLEIAAYILAKTQNNQVLQFEELTISENFRKYTENDIEQTITVLEEIDYIVIHNTQRGKNIVQIDNPASSW
jgi:hypothetical protein